jgi:L-seryl-tRNA(Ser) seleniumtransferase
MMAQGEAVLRVRAERLAAALGGAGKIVPTTGYAGGGTLPDAGVPSLGVALAEGSAERLKARLRDADPPVIARIADGLLMLDMLTVADDEIADIAAAVRQALA